LSFILYLLLKMKQLESVIPTSENNSGNVLVDNSRDMLKNTLLLEPPLTQTLDWTFGDKLINMRVYPIKWEKRILLNIHGTFWNMLWWDNKYEKLAQYIQKQWTWNAVIFETSRKNVPQDWSYEAKKMWFEWKTFDQELEDCSKVITWLIDNAENVFGVKWEDLEITINGNSLGGILALFLADKFPQVKNISTVWTGLLTKDKKNIPLLGDYPDTEELKECLSHFNGNFLLHYGTKDQLFSFDDFVSFYKSLQNARIWQIKMVWVDHTFKFIDWKKSRRPYMQIESDVDNLMKWKLVSWEIVPAIEKNPDAPDSAYYDDSDLDFFAG